VQRESNLFERALSRRSLLFKKRKAELMKQGGRSPPEIKKKGRFRSAVYTSRIDGISFHPARDIDFNKE